MISRRALPLAASFVVIAGAAHAAGPDLIATATLERGADFSGLASPLESGIAGDMLGGIGSGLAWAGGSTFLAIPDRGPNATAYAGGDVVDNTTSYVARFETVNLALAPTPSGGLPFTLTPTLKATTLLYSPTPLVYGATATLPSAAPSINAEGKSYFTGRSDNFGPGKSTDPSFARLDPEGIRVSNDGRSVFVSDEYGPYVYQFDRATGARLRTYALPDHFAIANLSAVGATEISGNTVGRVANKGMEGLAITPDGATLVGFMQSPLIQDGGDGGRANRIVTIDVASGATHEYAYDNRIGSKNFNSSEILALNGHQFLVLERDGKGLGDGSVAVVKQLWAVDIAAAEDVSGLVGQAALLAKAPAKTLFLDIVAVLTAHGVATTDIPAKLEGIAFGEDVLRDGVVNHTLYVGNDNDFVPDVAGPNRWFVFAFTDADLTAAGLTYTPQAVTPRDADLVLTNTPSSATVATGQTLTFTLGVANAGLVPANDVVVTETLPAGLEFVSCSTSSSGACGVAGGARTVGFATLAGAASQDAQIATAVSCALPDGAVLAAPATAAFDGVDPTPLDDAAAASVTAVNPPPVIGRLKVDHPTLVATGRMVPIHVSWGVSDNCPGATCGLTVTTRPAGFGRFEIVDAHTVRVLAVGSPRGGAYVISLGCQDSGGATTSGQVEVDVPRVRRR